MIYDYVIIGAGPVGLTLAYYLGKLNKKCILINHLGGSDEQSCSDLPSLQSDSRFRLQSNEKDNVTLLNSDMNKNFVHLLKNMGFNFQDIFVPSYDFKTMIYSAFNNLYIGEILLFFGEFMTLFFTDKFSKSISVNKYMKDNNFSKKSILYISKICKITDCNTLYQFLQLSNQISLYKVYQPNNKLLFKLWINAIKKTNNVDILNSDTIAIDVNYNQQNIDYDIFNICTHNNISITGKKYILKSSSNSLLESLKYNRNSLNNFYIIDDKNHNPKYNIVGIESSVTNAIELVCKLEPEFKYMILEPDTIIEICQFIFLITFILYIFRRTLRLF